MRIPRPPACAALLAAALGLAACGPALEWYRPGGDATLSQLDLDHCREAAQREAFFHYGLRGPEPIFDLARDRKGRLVYVPRRFYDPFHDRFFEEQRLQDFCMRSKGYDLRAVQQPTPAG